MRRPVQIYLDSSDYSDLSKPDAGLDPQLKRLREYLFALKESGAIEIRFSAAHISEITHLEFRYKPLAMQRAALISGLCGGKVLRWAPELFAMEAAAAFYPKKVQSFPLYGQSDAGRWFPHFHDSLETTKNILREQIREALREKGLPRDRRREIERTFIRAGRLRPELIPFVKRFQQTTTAQLEAMYPLSDSFYRDEMVLKWVTGEVSSKDFETELFKGVSDPKNFTGWYFDRFSEAKPSIFWLRDLSKEVAQILGTMVDKADEIRASSILPSAILERILREGLEEQRITVKRRLMPKLIEMSPELLAPYQISPSKLAKRAATSEYVAPGFDLFLDLWIEHAWTSTASIESRRRLKDSDFIDFVHSANLPYVDLFRADGYCANLIRSVAPELAKRVVPKLGQLERAINNALDGSS